MFFHHNDLIHPFQSLRGGMEMHQHHAFVRLPKAGGTICPCPSDAFSFPCGPYALPFAPGLPVSSDPLLARSDDSPTGPSAEPLDLGLNVSKDLSLVSADSMKGIALLDFSSNAFSPMGT